MKFQTYRTDLLYHGYFLKRTKTTFSHKRYFYRKKTDFCTWKLWRNKM